MKIDWLSLKSAQIKIAPKYGNSDWLSQADFAERFNIGVLLLTLS
jgi:hypothetical protein